MATKTLIFERHGAEALHADVYLPEASAATPAVIAIHGGGWKGGTRKAYQYLGPLLAGRGYALLAIDYRLVEREQNRYPAALDDVRGALRYVREHAGELNVDPARIVLLGDSAGGHLAALAATQPVPGNPEAEDPLDRVSSRPDYLVLAYPWIGALSSDTSHLSYCKLFNVMDRCEALRTAYSPDLFVSKDTPPTFLFHTFNDQTVPVEQGLRFYDALVKAGVPSEMHIFANGPHGVGLGGSDASLEQWPNLLDTWLRTNGLLSSMSAPAKP